MVARLLAALITLFICTPVFASSGVVAFAGYNTGTIIIHTKERRLYYIIAPGEAITFPVGVGKPGKQWEGTTYVSGKVANPSWAPPDEVKREEPRVPDFIPPGPHNPMGTRAILLAGNEYAIHGTNKPESVGHFVSFGCIRMHNYDVEQLYQYVQVGTPVVVMR